MDDEILDNIENEENPQAIRFAGFWIRVAATLIDSLVLLPVALLNIYNVLNMKILTFALLLGFVQMAYKIYMEFMYGATVGKMLMKIKVVNTNFEPITLNQAALRYGFNFLVVLAGFFSTIAIFNNPEFMEVLKFEDFMDFQQAQEGDFMSAAASFLFTLSVIVVAFDEKRQGWHDKLAYTYCIYN